MTKLVWPTRRLLNLSLMSNTEVLILCNSLVIETCQKRRRLGCMNSPHNQNEWSRNLPFALFEMSVHWKPNYNIEMVSIMWLYNRFNFISGDFICGFKCIEVAWSELDFWRKTFFATEMEFQKHRWSSTCGTSYCVEFFVVRFSGRDPKSGHETGPNSNPSSTFPSFLSFPSAFLTRCHNFI